MNIHEYQGKELFRQYGVNVPSGFPAFSADEAAQAAEKLGGNLWVVKAQIHAGGRGKAGGVKLAKSKDEVKAIANELLGKTLVTVQTGPEGQKVRRLYVEEGADIARELYLSMVVDRASSRIVIMASTEGGVDIETVAEETPEKIHYITIDPTTGYRPFQGRKLAQLLGIHGKSVRKLHGFLDGLYRLFMERDCSLVEINPLVVTGDDDIIALDAKLNFDDNGLVRQPEIEALRDEDEEDPAEIEAKKYGLSYVALEGDIGCMVNGAGLAMGTMDIIKHYGGQPKNFLDVGGSANAEQVAAAFRIITSDPNVKGIFINIFGGIMKCDVLAEGVVSAARELGLRVPLVVRLEGTNVEKGKQILRESGLAILPADTMAEGAKKIIEAIQ